MGLDHPPLFPSPNLFPPYLVRVLVRAPDSVIERVVRAARDLGQLLVGLMLALEGPPVAVVEGPELLLARAQLQQLVPGRSRRCRRAGQGGGGSSNGERIATRPLAVDLDGGWHGCWRRRIWRRWWGFRWAAGGWVACWATQ